MKSRFLAALIAFGLLAGPIFAEQFRTISDTTGKLRLSKNPAYNVVSLSANTTTPDVSQGTVFVTGINTGATAISGFSNAVAGNIITIVGNASTTVNATTIADSGAFKLSAAFTASANNAIQLLVRASGDYVEISRSSN